MENNITNLCDSPLVELLITQTYFLWHVFIIKKKCFSFFIHGYQWAAIMLKAFVPAVEESLLPSLMIRAEQHLKREKNHFHY